MLGDKVSWMTTHSLQVHSLGLNRIGTHFQHEVLGTCSNKHWPNASSYKFEPQVPQDHFNTIGVTYTTRRQANLSFVFPELYRYKTVEWSCHLDDKHTAAKMSCGMIIGLDLHQSLDFIKMQQTKLDADCLLISSRK